MVDPELPIIFGFILTIIMIGCGTGIYIHGRESKHMERKLELKARVAEAQAEQARYEKGDYSKMEERVRVLERIATDSNHALASQIDELRALDAAEEKAGASS